jgi:creatinine amidohydrolase
MHIDVPAQVLKTEKRKLIILPVGSCEQHGPHLPIDTDLRIAQLIAQKVTSSFSEEETLLLPAIPFSCSWEHKGLGTLALSIQTLSAILHDIAQSLKSWKIPVFFIIVNWHGGNAALSSITTEITAQENIPTAAIHALPIAYKFWVNEFGSLETDVHAGALETSIIQAFWSTLINISNLSDIDYLPNVSSIPEQLVMQAIGIASISQSGVWGTPHLAQAEKGKTILTHSANEIQHHLSKLLELLDAN